MTVQEFNCTQNLFCVKPMKSWNHGITSKALRYCRLNEHGEYSWVLTYTTPWIPRRMTHCAVSWSTYGHEYYVLWNLAFQNKNDLPCRLFFSDETSILCTLYSWGSIISFYSRLLHSKGSDFPVISCTQLYSGQLFQLKWLTFSFKHARCPQTDHFFIVPRLHHGLEQARERRA